MPRVIRMHPRPRRKSTAPRLIVRVEFEGPVEAWIRGCNGDELQAMSFRAWLEGDEELREFCALARRLRDRMAA